jgi:histidyl-tRNA synthetase
MEKPTLPKGTRDFGPAVMAKRQFIFTTIRNVFQKFGFQPLETPAMENLSTLTGKYGEEGDQLLFKILNSGDYLKDVEDAKLQTKNSKSISFDISEKGLRYDLTVPFARYVVMNRGEISFHLNGIKFNRCGALTDHKKDATGNSISVMPTLLELIHLSVKPISFL